MRRAAALLVLAALLPLASCRRPVSEEKRLSRELASDDDASATAALAEYARLDPPRRLEVVRLLASETTKYPFGLANAPTALRRLLPGVVPMLVELRGAPAMTSSADMALELLGPDAVGAVPSIERSIAGDDPKLRARAAAALATIAPERIAAVTRECGLEDVSDRAIGNLSKGYRQRVGIAQAMIGRPHVLVLDEPTAGLDPAQVLELRHLVAGLGGRTTVVLSSHILADVASVCDRVLILQSGKLVLAERVDALRREVVRSGELVLRTRGAAGALGTLLAGLSDLRVRGIESDGRGGLVARLVQVEPEAAAELALEESAAEIARRCVAGGWPVLEVGPRRRTLEDVFVELLGGER